MTDDGRFLPSCRRQRNRLAHNLIGVRRQLRRRTSPTFCENGDLAPNQIFFVNEMASGLSIFCLLGVNFLAVHPFFTHESAK